MYIISYFDNIVKYMQGKSTEIYLLLANVLLVIFSIWFLNVGILPFTKLSDFVVFSFLAFLFALYRPGWTFLFFVGSLALENINLAPVELGVSLRPYQFFGFLSLIALAILFFKKRIRFELPKWLWVDKVVIIFAGAGFLSSIFALQKGVSFKQSLIMLSFVFLYFLTRIYVQNLFDAKKILPFFLSSSLIVLIYGIWQNVRFSKGLQSFEIMPGRPNATFAEPDWLGMYLVFLIAVIMSILFYAIKKTKISNFQFPISNPLRQSFSEASKFSILEFFNQNTFLFVASYGLLMIVFMVLIITVARSAWLGAAIVSIGFLKMIAFNGLWNFGNPPAGEAGWNWKMAGYSALGIVFSFLLAFGFVKIFNLTSFELVNRAQSTASGFQEITISCTSENSGVPQKIEDISEISKYGCEFINLEDIENEKAKNNYVSKVLRPDPNIGVRAKIYKKSVDIIEENLLFGVGWGNVGKILGTDERGELLNSSNIFLEAWLGAGIAGLVSLLLILGYVLFYSSVMFLGKEDDRTVSVFVLLGFFAILVPNFFNAGIFLGFFWAYLGVAVGLLNKR